MVRAPDGADAREALRTQAVNLLITDTSLPDGSGFDVASEALRQNPSLPMIVFSGHDLREVAKVAGADRSFR